MAPASGSKVSPTKQAKSVTSTVGRMAAEQGRGPDGELLPTIIDITYCVPDWRKCGPARADILPNLKEAFGFFTSGKCLSCEQTGTKDYLQDPACNCTYNTPMCLGACCVPGCMAAMVSRNLAKMGDKSCESNCLSYCVFATCGAYCCVGACWYAKKRSDFRKKYNIKGSTAGDCCLSCCCSCCALCQDTNQLMAEDKSYKVPMAELPE